MTRTTTSMRKVQKRNLILSVLLGDDTALRLAPWKTSTSPNTENVDFAIHGRVTHPAWLKRKPTVTAR